MPAALVLAPSPGGPETKGTRGGKTAVIQIAKGNELCILILHNTFHMAKRHTAASDDTKTDLAHDFILQMSISVYKNILFIGKDRIDPAKVLHALAREIFIPNRAERQGFDLLLHYEKLREVRLILQLC